MPTQLNPQQQREFARKINNELDKMTMSWDNDLRWWHPIALKALRFASCLTLNIPQTTYPLLLKTENQGVNMNVVMILCNNVEGVTPAQMEVTPEEWAEKLELNARIAQRWATLAEPVERKVSKEFEIMLNKPKMVLAEA